MTVCLPWWVSAGMTDWQKYFFPASLSVPPTSRLQYQSSFCTVRYGKAVYQMVKLATISTALQPNIYIINSFSILKHVHYHSGQTVTASSTLPKYESSMRRKLLCMFSFERERPSRCVLSNLYNIFCTINTQHTLTLWHLTTPIVVVPHH